MIRAKRFTRKATFHITLGSVNHHYFANSGVFVYCWPQKLNPSMEIAGFLDKPYPHAGLQPDFWDDCPQGDGAFSCLLIRADNLIRVRRLREIHRVTFIGSKSDWCYVWTLKKKKTNKEISIAFYVRIKVQISLPPAVPRLKVTASHFGHW